MLAFILKTDVLIVLVRIRIECRNNVSTGYWLGLAWQVTLGQGSVHMVNPYGDHKWEGRRKFTRFASSIRALVKDSWIIQFWLLVPLPSGSFWLQFWLFFTFAPSRLRSVRT